MNGVYTVSQITQTIASYLEGDPYLTNVKVVGEVADFKVRKNHAFFNLVDDESRLPCVFFGRGNVLRLEDGEMVEVEGSLKVYRRGGYYTFNVSRLNRLGLQGSNELRFKKALHLLVAEGVLPKDRKEIEGLPERIGLITSKDSAALRDVMTTLEEANLPLTVYVLHSGVQGKEAKDELLKALKVASTMDLDALLIVRGGGSRDDLWIFNDVDVVRAVADMPFPVITGIGHSIDEVLVDRAADYVKITPTAAARVIVEMYDSFTAELDEVFDETLKAFELRVSDMETEIESYFKSIIFSVKERILTLEGVLERTAVMLECASPKIALEHGFALVLRSGSRVSSVMDLNVGDRLELLMRDGMLRVIVNEIRGHAEKTERDSRAHGKS